MGNIVIKSFVKKGGDERTLAGSLAKNGLSRAPGCGVTISPYRENDGRYRTGLDEDAIYIKLMPEDEQKAEKARIKALRNRLEKETGLDLGPFSDYYMKMWDDGNGKFLRAQTIKLKDGEKVFNMDDAISAITACWVSVHPIVAPSYQSFERGETAPHVGWYVSDKDVEDQIAYKDSMAITDILVSIKAMAPSAKKRLARLVELPVSEETKEETVFNLLYKLLQQGTIDFGTYKGKKPTRIMQELIDMKEETLAVKDLVRQSLQQGIYRRNKAGVIMQGNAKIADSESDLVAQIAAEPEDRVILQAKVDNKKKLTSA